MMRRVIICTVLTICLVHTGAVMGATYDLSGTWNFSNFNHSVTGGCPNGTDATGTLEINQAGDVFTLEFTSGMVCSPASMCIFTGTVDGAEYTGSNTAVVDNEGGVATNTFVFTASSETEAAGHNVSTYVGGTLSCEWNFDVTLTKADDNPDGGTDGGGTNGDDGGDPDGGSTSGDDGGSSSSDEDQKEDDGGGCSTAGNPAGGLFLLGLALIGLIRRRSV